MPQFDYSEAPGTVRAMCPDELVALADLWVASWRETMPTIDFDARWCWIATVLTDPANVVLVADRAGSPQGFAVLDGGSLLHQLVVAPGAKGQGVAAALLAAAKRRVGEGLVLEVNQTNGRAVRFYEREGFRRTGAGRNAGSGLATWHMCWP